MADRAKIILVLVALFEKIMKRERDIGEYDWTSGRNEYKMSMAKKDG